MEIVYKWSILSQNQSENTMQCEKKKTRGRLLTDRETFNEIEVFKTDFNPLDN